jgi:hypothetical protein
MNIDMDRDQDIKKFFCLRYYFFKVQYMYISIQKIKSQKEVAKPGFRIRIDLMRIRIRIRIQHFF